jgi:phasin
MTAKNTNRPFPTRSAIVAMALAPTPQIATDLSLHMGIDAMTELTATTKAENLTTPINSIFGFVKFAVAGAEMPTACREFAEKSLIHIRDGYERLQVATRQATEVIEDIYATAAEGASKYQQNLVAATDANVSAILDYTAKLLVAKSLSDLIELTMTCARQQFETMTVQTKEISLLTQKITTAIVEPLKVGFTKAPKNAA